MPRDTRDTTRRGQNGPAVRTQSGRTSQGGVEVATDLDLAGILTRLTMDLEHFEATLAIERGCRPGFRAAADSHLAAQAGETDEIYGQRPAAAPQPSRQGRAST